MAARHRIPAAHATRGWLLAREDPRGGVPAVFSERLSSRARPVDLIRRNRLGRDGACPCDPRRPTNGSGSVALAHLFVLRRVIRSPSRMRAFILLLFACL